MDRRTFMASAGAAGLASMATGLRAETGQDAERNGPFTLKYAPHFGMFRNLAGDDPVAQLEFAANEGFRAWEDNGMSGRSEDDQRRIAAAMERLGIEMGVFVLNPGTAWGPNFSRGRSDDLDRFLAEARNAVDVAKRVNAKWMTVVPGTREQRLPMGYQTAYTVDALRRACEILEPHGLVMVLEPLNPRDHPNMLLAEMGHAYEICRAVDSPSCKILCDVYHQQATEGNLLDNIDRSWSEIGYFQVGDNPGRREPTTGEINYTKIFSELHRRGFDGIIGMEHGNAGAGADGERAVINAYRSCDP